MQEEHKKTIKERYKTYWCVYNKGKEPQLHTISYKSNHAIDKFCTGLFTWEEYLESGYSVKKVKITPIEP